MSNTSPEFSDSVVVPLFPEISDEVLVREANRLAEHKPELRPGIVGALLRSIELSNEEVLAMLGHMESAGRIIDGPKLIGEIGTLD